MTHIRISTFFKNIKILSAFAFVSFLIQRIAFLGWSYRDLNFDLAQGLKAFFIGTLFDYSVITYLLIPQVLLFVLYPSFKNENRGRSMFSFFLNILNFIFIFFVLYMITTEMFFWDEFHARYNFIAVDYLVYTTEVLKNVWESYPVFKILLALFILTLLIMLQVNSRLEIATTGLRLRYQKLKLAGCALLIVMANYFLISQSYTEIPKDIAYQELSKNGSYSILYSYFENQINYDQFYIQLDKSKAINKVKSYFSDKIETLQIPPQEESVRRTVLNPEVQKPKMNVVLVLMESMGARFMASYGNKESLTPNLDALASEGLFFNNIYATGTRTVRGIEAITLSIPPTPGQSIVRRPNNEKLVTINSYFAKADYDVQFLYGGYAYFDNMKYYFENNDSHVLDLSKMKNSDVSFSNAWGVCDEDIYNYSIKNADISYQAKKPFFQILLTTSNHRPFTYPEGKIDIPSGTGRAGAVKYSDYAIGKFIEKVETKPWFKNTVFVFVADHDAGVAGNAEVLQKDYLVPLIFFAPGMIKPQTISRLGSQIDVGPTLLGLLGMSYESFGFGYDLREDHPERAFISNYQKIGLLKKNFLTLLSPGKKFKQFKIASGTYSDVDLEKDELDSTISFYQTASHLFKSNKLKKNNEQLLLKKQIYHAKK